MSASAVEPPCYALITSTFDSEVLTEATFRQDLETGDDNAKYECMKRIICQMMNGERFPSLLMPIIRFVLPTRNNQLKKLLMLYWELVPKHSHDGKLLQEMILVCDAFRRDLIHPNEYVRGATLRLLCRLRQPELIEPLIQTIQACLDHRLAYVRRNAISAIFSIYQNFPHLIQDAPSIILNFLESEMDHGCRRNAFVMLLNVDQHGALGYVERHMEQIHTFTDTLQLIIVQLISKVCRGNTVEKQRFSRLLHILLQSASASVRFDAAGALVSLSSAASAIKASAECYRAIGVEDSDNNVKLVVLERLMALKDCYGDRNILQPMAVEFLSLMESPDMEVTEKTIELVNDLISSRNIGEVVQLARRELTKSHGSIDEKTAEKRKYLIVQMLNRCSIRFPEKSRDIALMLSELLPQLKEKSALAVMNFIKVTIVKEDADFRRKVVEYLSECFPFLAISSVMREIIWLVTEFSETEEELQAAFNMLRNALADYLKTADNPTTLTDNEHGDFEKPQTVKSSAPKITADGSYATQSAYATTASSSDSNRGNTNSSGHGGPLASYLNRKEPDFMLAVTIASGLSKLVIKMSSVKATVADSWRPIATKICVSFLSMGGLPSNPDSTITRDEFDKIFLCVHLINDLYSQAPKVFETSGRGPLGRIMNVKNDMEKMAIVKEKVDVKPKAEFDDSVQFRWLSAGNRPDDDEGSKLDADWLEKAVSGSHSIVTTTGSNQATSSGADYGLSPVTQLSGLSDPIYAECILTVTHFDIGLDILLVNQTTETLQNVTVELSTLGDLRITERPRQIMMAPSDMANVSAHIKVSSTENAVVHGTVSYDLSSGRTICIVLNELSIDVLDYISADQRLTDEQFRQMWIGFEWENKIGVTTPCKSLWAYIHQLSEGTSMSLLASSLPDDTAQMEKDAGFLAANLYGRSVFGEDVLANVSVEIVKSPDQKDWKVAGHIRIRAKSQGMALSMGDRMNKIQKSFTE